MKSRLIFRNFLARRHIGTVSSNFSEHFALKRTETQSTSHPQCKSKEPTLFVPGHRGQNIYQIVKPFIDVSYLVENEKSIKESCELRGVSIDFGFFIEAAQKWKRLRDAFATQEYQNDEYNKEIRRLKSENKEEECDRLISEHEEFLKPYRVAKNEIYDLEEVLMPQFSLVPNCIHIKTPLEASVSHYYHEVRHLDFEPSSHVTLGEKQQYLEFSPASPTAYFLKGKLSLLELSIQDFFAHQLSSYKFTSMVCTDFSKSFIVEACGGDPHSFDDCIPLMTKGRRGGQNLNLVGSASLESFCAYLSNMNVAEDSLPAKYFCCGRFYDAGRRNCSSKSLFNVVQSTNVHCLILSQQNGVDSSFEELVNIIYSCYIQLGLPFRMTNVSARHLNVTESRRVQFEIWSPYFQKYFVCGHVSSRDDFISKRLRATYGLEFKVHGYVNMVEGVAGKVPSLIAGVIENCQNAEGDFSVPEILKKYMLI